MSKVKQIYVYSDGGSRNHGNVKGGHVKSTDSAAWAYLIQYPNGVNIKQSGYENGATNNQMELLGVIKALSTITNRGMVKLDHPVVTVITDSKYIFNAFTKGWIRKWQKRKFKKVKNANYWKILLFMISHIANLHFKWVKGHADNQGNNYVDKLLNLRMDHVEAASHAKRRNKNQEKVGQ